MHSGVSAHNHYGRGVVVGCQTWALVEKIVIVIYLFTRIANITLEAGL